MLYKRTKQILELKNSINEMRNGIKSSGNRADFMEERISKLEDRNLKMIQIEERREVRSRENWDIYENYQLFQEGSY